MRLRNCLGAALRCRKEQHSKRRGGADWKCVHPNSLALQFQSLALTLPVGLHGGGLPCNAGVCSLSVCRSATCSSTALLSHPLAIT